MLIRLRRTTADGIRETRNFKTLKGAQRFAHKWVGETPTLSAQFNYAVDDYGIQKIEAAFTRISQLFPALEA